MNQFTASWTQLFVAIVFLALLYLILMTASRVTGRSNLFGRFSERIHNFLELLLKIFEPISLLLITVLFVAINPLIHGLIVLLILIFTFGLIRNYVYSWLFAVAHHLNVGQRIQVDGTKGVIKDMQRLGLTLQTKNGAKFIQYSSLMQGGYMILKGEEIGGLHQLVLSPNGEDAPTFQKIKNRLFSCPYVDWNYKPKINTAGKDARINVQLLLREEQHLSHLKRLIEEWGYNCTVSK